MGKNIIVSEDTIRDLLEAHASLSAWYYALWSALRVASATADAPDDAARAAFVERMAVSFPEVASIARSIKVPKMFVPPPPSLLAPPAVAEGEEPPTAIEPAPARLREIADQARAARREAAQAAQTGRSPQAPAAPGQGQPPSSGSGISPPPLVVPSEVKYNR